MNILQTAAPLGAVTPRAGMSTEGQLIKELAQRRTRSVLIPARSVALVGDLTIPAGATAIVIFVHGSGSSRLSPRNRLVAEELQDGGFSTLLFDLLTSQEDALDAVTGQLRFDINLLSLRLVDVSDWIMSQSETRGMRLGYFGASTGAAAALVAATLRPKSVCAIVSRGGRPDLAGRFLPLVSAPTLLIVGGADLPLIALNEEALRKMKAAVSRLAIVPGATHLFEKSGALADVSQLARHWFEDHCDTTSVMGHG
jgi:dienelactone hydrolase